MAEKEFLREEAEGRTYRVVWANLGNGDTGKPVTYPGAGDFTMQVVAADFGAGGAVLLEGSCEKTPVNYFTLKDPQGNDLSFSADGGELVSEGTTWVRPRVPTGDGNTDITVTLLLRSTMR